MRRELISCAAAEFREMRERSRLAEAIIGANRIHRFREKAILNLDIDEVAVAFDGTFPCYADADGIELDAYP